MFSHFRNLGLLIILFGIILIFACGTDKTIAPGGNHPPAVPSNPSPANEATGIGTSGVILRWHCSDPDDDTLKYDFYFDTLNTPVMVFSNQYDSNYMPESLELSREYYWNVVARDEHGSEAASPIWHFATIPGQEQIVFSTVRGGRHSIYIMNADGSNTRNLSGDLDGWFPLFNYDGSKIAFTALDGAYCNVFTMNHDGANWFQVTFDSALIGSPVWSGNGTQIAYAVERSPAKAAAIYVVNADGSNPHAITDLVLPEEGGRISWSQVGPEIAFAHYDTAYHNLAIAAVNSDGTNMHDLTSFDYYNIEPAWSNDGTRIAFARTEDRVNYQIYVMNADGSDQRNISNSGFNDRWPSWSHDDSQIAFVSDRNGGEFDIFMMNDDGSNQYNVTNNPAYDFAPSWGPWHR